jgi:hypothetical protein
MATKRPRPLRLAEATSLPEAKQKIKKVTKVTPNAV